MHSTTMATQNHVDNQPYVKIESSDFIHGRRCANYKPNIWSYHFIQSLTTQFTEPTYRSRAKELKEKLVHLLSKVPDLLSKLHFVDSIIKLGLFNLFSKEIKDALDSVASHLNAAGFKDDILATALSFRLLRQQGYNVSQDVFVEFIDKMGALKESTTQGFDLRGVLELYEASHHATEGEDLMVGAKGFSYQNLLDSRGDMDIDLAKQVTRALELPCHRRVIWFNVRHHINAYHEHQHDWNPMLLELASLNFNIVQANHLEELKEMSRWWRTLKLIESVNFTRDRLVESFVWTVGVSCDPQHTLFRKCLTKVVTFILVIDDLYDIYASLQELQCFTRAVDGWDFEEVQQLPECMKICFQLLQQTTDEISSDIEKQKGWDDILTYLKLAWADFCKALLQEAWWHNKGYIPSVQDYLNSAWITSSGPLLALIAILCTANLRSEELRGKLEECKDLIHYTSLIIRLCNDLGTSAAEIERGDAPSSILCYMIENGVPEETARDHIKEDIDSVWSKINLALISGCKEQPTFVNLIINSARVCHFIYSKGDGFGVQDGETSNLIKRLLIKPVEF